MKKSIILAVVVTILAAFEPARADEVIPPTARQSVVGEGITDSYIFSIYASTVPSGEAVVGSVYIGHYPPSAGDVVASGGVTLLCVSGKRAVIAGAVEYGPSSGKWYALHVEDNGQTTPPSDLLRLEILDAPPTDCAALAFNLDSPWQVTGGDIGVADGRLPPAPMPPLANADIDQSVHQGAVVTLDGSGSSDPDDNYPLSYDWKIISRPEGSSAALLNPVLFNPSFTADVAGDYKIQLIVTDSKGMTSAPDEVLVSTYNTAPVADAGTDKAITLAGTTVTLYGTQSYDPEGDPITYQWAITAKPDASSALISDPAAATPTFIADVNGTYEISLIVSDPWVSSTIDSVTVSFNNVKPIADAGGNQSILLGETATFDGRSSSDANLDPLSFHWNLVSKPGGSQALLACLLRSIQDPVCTHTARLEPDMVGTYVVSLTVNDGIEDSAPSNVTVTVLSGQDRPKEVLRQLIEAINGLDPAVFKNANMAKALTNKINAVLADIEQGNYAAALDKLRNDILGKTDGCAVEGTTDKNDWIKTCSAQGQVYPMVMEAIRLLEGML